MHDRITGQSGTGIPSPRPVGPKRRILIFLMAAALNPELEMIELDAFPVRERVSQRAYTGLRLRTRSEATGYGECSRVAAADLAALRSAIRGKEAGGVRELMEQSVVDILQTDVHHVGGITALVLDLDGAACVRGVWQEWFGFPAMRIVNGEYPLPEKPD
jgi:hypothetical protein